MSGIQNPYGEDPQPTPEQNAPDSSRSRTHPLQTADLQQGSMYQNPTAIASQGKGYLARPLEGTIWVKVFGIFCIIQGAPLVLFFGLGLIFIFSGIHLIKAADAAEKYQSNPDPDKAHEALDLYTRGLRLQGIYIAISMGLGILFMILYFIMIFVVIGMGAMLND